MNTCQNCRAFFPLDATTCPHCGTSIIPHKIRIEGGLFDRFLPAGGLSVAIIGLNVTLYLAMLVVQGGPSGGMLGVSSDTVEMFGGLRFSEVHHGEDWHRWHRLVCPIFLHFSVLHLGFNCLVIWILGRIAEVVYGPAKLLTLYLACGIVASATTLLWNWDSGTLSAGASGAAFGLFGLLGVFAFRRGLDDMKRSVVQWTVINLVIGFTVPGIDMAAHVGGLAAGIVFAWKLKDAPMTRLYPKAVRLWDTGAIAAIVVVFACFGIAILTGGLLERG
ncbi:MAG: rhomboid family intramembrane serine protease [Planctomycetota bacterium]